MFWNNFFSFLWHYTFFQDTRIRAIRRYWHVALGDLGKPALPDRNKPCAWGRCCCWGAAVMIGGLEEQPCNTGTILQASANKILASTILAHCYNFRCRNWEVVQRGVGNRGGHPHAPCLVQMENVPRRPTWSHLRKGMTRLLLFQKVECNGDPIFKVVLEC